MFSNCQMQLHELSFRGLLMTLCILWNKTLSQFSKDIFFYVKPLSVHLEEKRTCEE